MTKPNTHGTVRVVLHRGEPVIEARFRAIGEDADGPDGPIPKGKILIMRTPLLTPGCAEDDIEQELIDDDGAAEAFCPECAAEGLDPHEMSRFEPFPPPFSAGKKYGRNDPCPCGSGRKYKRCCLN